MTMAQPKPEARASSTAAIGSDHVQRAVGEVDDAQGAEDEGQPERDKGIDGAELQPGQDHQEDDC